MRTPWGQLAVSVNRMLDEIERLMEEVRGVGDDIAHDLRTPLTRLRGAAGRAAWPGPTRMRGAGPAWCSAAIEDLDQAFAGDHRAAGASDKSKAARAGAGFAAVDLSAIARGVGELYQPVAELRDVTLNIAADSEIVVQGDRDLLFEAVGQFG